jgi:23S rRNA (uridine2552-2'-O)-methyltransferase
MKPPKRRKKPQPFIAKDQYFYKAKDQWFRARSAFKLEELDKKFELIQEWMNICDVGAAPGSFMQYIFRKIRNTGIIVGIDLKKIEKCWGESVFTLQEDIFNFAVIKPKIEDILWGEGKQFDLITSDIAPNTTGRKDVDQYASIELNIEILKFADVFLKNGWNLLLKVFKWEDFFELVKEMRLRFERFEEYKPLASRDRSNEWYVICYNKKWYGFVVEPHR